MPHRAAPQHICSVSTVILANLARIGALATAVALAASAPAQTFPAGVRQLANLNANVLPSASSSPGAGLVVGNNLFFIATTPGAGTELWISDGTPAGTRLLRDIRPGTSGSNPGQLTAFGSRVLFAADDGVHGRELWISDGTLEGTALVRDIRPRLTTPNPPPNPDSSPTTLVLFPGAPVGVDGAPTDIVLFTADDGTNGRELWATDGTQAGTRLVRDINPGADASSPSSIAIVPVAGAGGQIRAVFRANNPAQGGGELWQSDGTQAGTTLYADINPNGDSNPTRFTRCGVDVFFIATATLGTELYRLTPNGVELIADIFPGALSGLSAGASLVNVGGVLVFPANDGQTGTELWRVDARLPSATRVPMQIVDLNPGALGGVGAIVEMGSEAYFVGNAPATGAELYATNGTVGNVRLVADITVGPTSSSIQGLSSLQIGADRRLALSAIEPTTGRELWISDGGIAQRASDIAAGAASSDPTVLGVIGESIILSATSDTLGRELFTCAPLVPATSVLKDIQSPNFNGGSLATDAIAAGGPTSIGVSGLAAAPSGLVYFTATTPTTGEEVFVTDFAPTPAGTRLATDIATGAPSSSPRWYTAVGSRVVVAARTTSTGEELHLVQPPMGAPSLIRDINFGSASSTPSDIVVLGSRLVFPATTVASGRELWTSDLTSSGTRLVQELSPDGQSSSPGSLCVFGDRVIFSATTASGGAEPHVFSGTSITRIVDLLPGATGSSPQGFTRVGSLVVFSAVGPDNVGRELFVTDGTAAGTQLLRDINPDPGLGSNPNQFVPFSRNGVPWCAFVATDPFSGTELWITDGTALSTSPATEIGPGNADGNLRWVTNAGSVLLFAAGATSSDIELWSFDPRTSAVQLIRDVNSTANMGSSIGPIVMVDGLAFFSADDGTSGAELWVSDATPSGTRRYADINPGTGSSSPTQLRSVASGPWAHLFFYADNGTDGPEPHAVSICRLDVNRTGSTDLDDLFAWLLGWFDINPRMDFDGSGTTTLDDVFVFLAAWFVGC